mmetsp:Transcript_21938/g.47359  ORF Transcript_21938/g.47359 Transcript_21938/m.47359 type:complete len:357 (-) Transcript_21938:582-1652(-)
MVPHQDGISNSACVIFGEWNNDSCSFVGLLRCSITTIALFFLLLGSRIPIVRQFSHDVRGLDGPIVSHDDHGKQLFVQRLALGMTHLHERRTVEIQHDKIRLPTRGKVTNLVLQLQRLGVAQGGQVQTLEGRQCLAIELVHLVRFVERLQHGHARATAHVGGDAVNDLFAFEFVDFQQPRPQKQVGRGTKTHARPCFAKALVFAGRQVNAVRKDGPGAQQVVVVVDIQIVQPFRKEFLDKGHFLDIFRNVRLHVHGGIFLHEFAGQFQLFRRAGNGKPGRHGVELSTLLVPFLDQGLAIVVRRLRRVAQKIGRVAIHHDFTANHARVAGGAGFEKGLRRFLVHRRKHEGRGGTVAQ